KTVPVSVPPKQTLWRSHLQNQRETFKPKEQQISGFCSLRFKSFKGWLEILVLGLGEVKLPGLLPMSNPQETSRGFLGCQIPLWRGQQFESDHELANGRRT